VIYRVRHLTRYDYQSTVDLSVHLAHLTPRTLPFQTVREAVLRTDPPVSWTEEGQDHFGNDVVWLFVDLPHAALEVTTEAVVEVCARPVPETAATPAWEAVAADAGEACDAAGFLWDSPLAPAEAAARAFAAPCFAPGRPVLGALLELNRRIRAEFTFRAGVTTTATPIAEILRRREGVCQDFTHLMISMLRGFGIPARYVSGYIRTRPVPGQARRLGADQSHAWVGAWLGPAHGWIDLDPTNALVVGEEHVVLGWGRDYGDVAPLRGVILGGGEQRLCVEVELEAVG
jgi:transglutaminase-like putative cysteine protease